MKEAIEITTKVLKSLNEAEIPHMVVGAFARSYHSFARATQDADIVVTVGAAAMDRLASALGEEFTIDPQATFETNTGTFRFCIIHRQSAFKTELFVLSSDPFDQERFRRRRPFIFNGLPSFVLTAEDVIITKLRWARPKDLEDVRDVIAVQGDRLDSDYLHHWTALHGTRAKLDEIRASIPPLD